MRAFRCSVVLSTTTREGAVVHGKPLIWIVKADDEEMAGKKIFLHFREYGYFNGRKSISSIEYTEIILHGNVDLEEYLESQEEAMVCVLF